MLGLGLADKDQVFSARNGKAWRGVDSLEEKTVHLLWLPSWKDENRSITWGGEPAVGCGATLGRGMIMGARLGRGKIMGAESLDGNGHSIILVAFS